MSTTHSSGRLIELNAVVRTALLRDRPPRRPDCETETRALVSLAQVLANPPRDILQRLAEVALELCEGGSAGISIIEDHQGEQVFRWHALTGALASHRWGVTPRDFSPCGTVIDRNAVQLMYLPERYFLYFANVKPQIVEGLLVPFAVHGQTVGTVWVVTHDEHRKFDAEDERLVKELGQLASKAYQLASSVAASKVSDLRKHEFLATLAHELRSPPFAPGNALPDPSDRVSSTVHPPLQGMSDFGECQLQSMKRTINELLDHSRMSLETVMAASALSDPFSDAASAGPESTGLLAGRRTVPRRGAIRLARQAAGNGGDHLVHGSSLRTVSAATDPVSLLRRMRSGDQRALEELYDCTIGSVYALAQAILKSAEDAEEVVCDTYARAWRQSERFDVERASPLGWLMMMCRSHAIDRLRHNRSRGAAKTVALETVSDIANDALAPEELLSLFQNGSRVQCALATLSPKRQQLVRLAFFEGLSFPEMAERTGLPLGTVKSDVRRALVELRRRLRANDSRST